MQRDPAAYCFGSSPCFRQILRQPIRRNLGIGIGGNNQGERLSFEGQTFAGGVHQQLADVTDIGLLGGERTLRNL